MHITLIFSAVLGAGGLLHSNKFAGDLADYPENSKPRSFDFEWDDPDKLTFILGHHLIFLGLEPLCLLSGLASMGYMIQLLVQQDK